MKEQSTDTTKQEEAGLEQSPTARAIHDSIYQDAEHELERKTSALFWSGLAAGLAMGFSMVTEGILEAYLPNTEWSILISSFGYSIGFIIVIIGKQQLFTENTLTPVLPLLHHKSYSIFRKVMRLWSIVLLANLIGALLFALVVAKTSVFSEHVVTEFVKLGTKAMEPDFITTLFRAVFAGWLIALMVWLLPNAKSGQIWIIILITYIIGIAHFSHVIAGAVETFTIAVMQKASWGEVLLHYMLPTLIGNIAGGVILVATINYLQIKSGLNK